MALTWNRIQFPRGDLLVKVKFDSGDTAIVVAGYSDGEWLMFDHNGSAETIEGEVIAWAKIPEEAKDEES